MHFGKVDKEAFEEIKLDFPQIFHNFKQRIAQYRDRDMVFRRDFVRAVPYFRNMGQ